MPDTCSPSTLPSFLQTTPTCTTSRPLIALTASRYYSVPVYVQSPFCPSYWLVSTCRLTRLFTVSAISTMDPDNPLYGRLGFPVHEEQVPAALNHSDQASAQGPRHPFSQVAHSTAGQASPGQERPQVSFPVVSQVAQPAIAPSTLLHGQAGPGEPALAHPQVPQPGAFVQAAVVQPGQRQRSRASSRAPQIQRQKENRQANAAELVSQSPSLPELESHEHLLTENIMQ